MLHMATENPIDEKAIRSRRYKTQHSQCRTQHPPAEYGNMRTIHPGSIADEAGHSLICRIGFRLESILQIDSIGLRSRNKYVIPAGETSHRERLHCPA
jgi:hypothetical protein